MSKPLLSDWDKLSHEERLCMMKGTLAEEYLNIEKLSKMSWKEISYFEKWSLQIYLVG